MLKIILNANYQLILQENFAVDTHDHICSNVIRSFYFYKIYYFFFPHFFFFVLEYYVEIVHLFAIINI